MVAVKRKVIQIADSTQLVSLPRKWAKLNNVKKGDEIEVEENNNRIIISVNKESNPERVEIDASNLGIMLTRCVHALYKRGVDEIRFTFDNPELIKKIQEAMGKEVVGFEIIDQGKNHCVAKHVTGQFEEFDPILRRIFLLLLSMGEDIATCLKKKDYDHLQNIVFLEETNNRFTTACRRYLNRRGHTSPSKTGAMYYIVEDLEKLADEYKYLCTYFYERRKESVTVSEKTLELLSNVNQLLRDFYELFYKFDMVKLTQIAKLRKKYIEAALTALEEAETKYDRVTLHHILTVTQKIFNYLGPYLVMEL